MKSTLAVLVAAFGVMIAAAIPSAPARADDNGVAASIHDLRREGRRWCQDGHFHTGNSAGAATKKAAMAEAIDSWQGFTAFEYGTDWAYFRIAASKSVKCSQGPGGGWGCEVEARPCKKR